MVNEIDLLVCDDCDLILLGEGEGHICMHCEKPFVSAKFVRQPTPCAADGGESSLEDSPFETGIRRGAVVIPPAAANT